MQSTNQILLNLLGRALFSEEIVIPKNTDWKDLYKEATAQAVAPLVFDCLKPEEINSMPDEIKESWQDKSFRIISFREQLLYKQKNILELLKSENINCIILKGDSVGVNYPNPALRTMGDIDLLVSPKDQTKAVEILLQNGFSKVSNDNHSCHSVLYDGNCIVEIHKEPNGIARNDNKAIAEKLDAFFADQFDRAQMFDGTPVLSDEHQAVVLILHKLEHILEGQLGLRQLCDWAKFVEKRLTPELFKTLKPKLEAFGLLTFTKIITSVCCEYLYLPITCAAWCGDYDKTLASEVMDLILRAGNFGKKEKLHGKPFFNDTHSANQISAFAKNMIPYFKLHWKACEKHPILLPLAPFVMCARYTSLYIKGERPKLNLIKLFKSSGPKQKVNYKLKAFIVDNKED